MIRVIQQGSWLKQQSENNPESIAVISGKRELSYRELYEKSLSISSQFSKYEINPDDHVALVLNNSLEFVLLICASWLRGCLPVVINPVLKKKNVQELAEYSKSQLVIVEDSADYDYDNIKTIKISELMKDSAEEFNQQTNTCKDAVLIYTSGTSGSPKGVPITFSNLYQSVSAIDEIDKYSQNDRFLLSLPLYHIGGLSILARSLLAGARLIIPDVLNLINLSSKFLEYQPSIISIVPTMLKALVEEETVLPESLRLMYAGGGPADESIITKAIDMKYPIVKVYGSTETCAMITYADTEILRHYPDSSGKLLGNSRIEILDEKGQILKAGQSGEIVIQSDTLFTGYFDNESETGDKLVSGRYFSGDIGYMDADNNLFVQSRREDLIVTGGENVIPAEIVTELNKHPAIVDSAVFAVDDTHWGQMVCAAVVIDKDSPVSSDDLTEFLRGELPSFKIPKRFYYLENLPYNDLGKVNIKELKGTLNLNV